MTSIKSETFSDLLTDLAEKIGESQQSTTDARKRMINNAYRTIARRRLWHWLETSSTEATTTALSYTLPSDFRAFRPVNPVKIGTDWRVLVNQADQQLYDGSSSVVSLPQLTSKKRAYMWGGSIYFIQTAMVAAQTITYYYYKQILGTALMDNLTDEPLVPVEFREVISLLAAGNFMKSQGGRENVEGSDYLEIYDQYMKEMEEADDRRQKLGIIRRALDPEEAAILAR